MMTPPSHRDVDRLYLRLVYGRWKQLLKASATLTQRREVRAARRRGTAALVDVGWSTSTIAAAIGVKRVQVAEWAATGAHSGEHLASLSACHHRPPPPPLPEFESRTTKTKTSPTYPGRPVSLTQAQIDAVMAGTDRLLNIDEAATLIRLSEQSLRRWVSIGLLPSTRNPGNGRLHVLASTIAELNR